MTVGYRGTRTGKRAVQYELVGPSLGASSAHDGAFHAHPVTHNTPSAPIEILETEFPMRMLACAPLPDSGGPGRFRGGLGCLREYELLDDAIFTLRVGGFRSGSWGVEGGLPGVLGRCIVDPGRPTERSLPSLFTTDLPAGTVLRVEQAGGSGFGDPESRDREHVLADVQNGYVSVEAAAEVYGVRIRANADGTFTVAGDPNAES